MPQRFLGLGVLLTCILSIPVFATPPNGPYRTTCKSLSMKGTTLSAVCKDFFGNLKHSTLGQASQCHNIRNINGDLRCVISSRPVTVHGDKTEFDIVSLVSQSRNTSTEVKLWHIDQPDVTQISTLYRDIKFRPGDKINVSANGCVQTGGSGSTWKLYVDPEGSNSAAMYFGQLQIPGVTGGLQPIAALIANSPLSVPDDLKITVMSELFLWLGYMDDNRSDNGYWNHDDGNGNQCKGIGPASVEVRVESDLTKPPIEAAFSPHKKPFDLVWDMNNTDYNGLPMNPKWTAQVFPKAGPPPDFAKTCQSAFSMALPPDFTKGDYSGNPDTIDRSKLNAICTTQDPYTDLRGYSSFDWSGLCASDLLHGHLDWMVATYTGQITWDHFSGHWPHDRDYNMNLFRPDRAGLTADNLNSDDLTGKRDFFLGLEFDAGETVDNFTSSWWKQLSSLEPYLSPTNGTMNTDQDPAAERFMGGSDGLFGVVTGLVGLDAIHGAPTELHPVFSIALRIAQPEVLGDGQVDEQWAFFIRNSGDEGECSQLMHYWDGFGGTYYVQFPWPTGATDVSVIKQDIGRWKKNVNVVGFEKDPRNGMTLLKVQMPPDDGYGLDGQVTLRYSIKSGHPERIVMGGVKPQKEEPERGLANVSELVSDPDVRQKFDTELRALEPKPHVTERIHADVSTAVAMHEVVPGPAAKGELTRTRVVTDAARAKLLADTNALLLKYKDSVTVKPAPR